MMYALLLSLLVAFESYAAESCENQEIFVGSAKADITGPPLAAGMQGYVRSAQKSAGLHTRLWARAHVVAGSCSKRTVVLLTLDLGHVFQLVRQEIIERLRESSLSLKPGDILISATHTHGGPGGYAGRGMYNLNSGGFDRRHFERIVKGAVAAVEEAYQRRVKGQLTFGSATTPRLGHNRSAVAWAQNPESNYLADFDNKMHQLHFLDNTGQILGLQNWLGVHGVSFSMFNPLISSDNKGLAAELAESYLKSIGADSPVAAFAQGPEGDVSPHVIDSDGTEPGRNEWLRNLQSATAQLQVSKKILKQDAQLLKNKIGGSIRYVDFSSAHFRSAHSTCEAALGVSFAAGTENGRPVEIFKEGLVFGKEWPGYTLVPEFQDCHGEKPVLLPVGLEIPKPWVGQILPFQVIRLGKLIILAVPFEMTVTAGHRLVQYISERIGNSFEMIIAGLSNGYSHYLTTPEEYSVQHYEGASNLFGKNTLQAVQEILSSLVTDLVENINLEDIPRPRIPLPATDTKRYKKRDQVQPPYDFGDQLSRMRPVFSKRATIRALFLVGSPLHDYDVLPNWSWVERKSSSGSWEVYLNDDDHRLLLQWRLKSGVHKLELTWKPLSDRSFGHYRFCVAGTAQTRTGSQSYRNCGQSFVVR